MESRKASRFGIGGEYMRLIDADALIEVYANRLEILAQAYGVHSGICGALAGAMKLLETRPTIEPEQPDKTVCPFCGKPVESRYYRKYRDWSYGCRNEECKIRPVTQCLSTEEAAIEEWNNSYTYGETT